ncbi:MAG: CynX/NimT family MFS transporter [Agromyces sp.]
MTGSLLRGRVLATAGIVLVALNMRTAVAALSPLVSMIRAEFDMSTWVIATLGMIPPLCYGVFGVLSGRIARRFGLERTLLWAVVAIASGTFGRALVHAPMTLLAWTTVLFAGIGVGNVLLPPLVKKYFPDRIGLMTTIYVTMFAIGNVIPPLVAIPVADVVGWRFSVGMWAATAGIAVVPWVFLLRAHRRDGAPVGLGVAPDGFKPWHSSTTWAILALFFCSGFNSYALFAWMPQILADRAEVTGAASGALLSLYASLGFPLGLVIPVLVARFQLERFLVLAALGLYAVGYGGLLLAPTAALALWVVCAAAGTLTFAASLTLINLRTHSPTTATATSSFVQGVGYSTVAVGVLGFGVVHSVSGGWDAPLIYAFVCSLVLIPAAIVLGRRQFIDEPV